MLKSFFTKIRRNLQMKLVWKLRRHIFSQKISRGIALVNASLYIFLFGILVWGFDKIIPFIKYIQDPAIATLIGAIVGALVGGMFAYTAAVDVHKRELEATAALKRRNEIYLPLYNEIISLRSSIKYDAFDKIIEPFKYKKILLKKPQFWASLKEDIKNNQIPIDFRNAMEDLSSVIDSCENAQEEIKEDKELQKLFLKMTKISRIQTDRKEEQVLQLRKIENEINLQIPVINFEVAFNELEIKSQDTVEYLEELIKFINNRYEQRANWY